MDEFKWVTVTKTIRESIFGLARWAYLNYPNKWLAGDKRNLPKSLRDKLSQQGIVLVDPEPNARESVKPAQPKALEYTVDVEKLREKYKDEPRLEVVMQEGGMRHGWKSGAYKAHFEDVLNYPLEWMRDEVREIPYSLYHQLAEVGVKLSAQPEDVYMAQNRKKAQVIHGHRLNKWREEQAARREQAQAKHMAHLVAEAMKEEVRKEQAKQKADILKKVQTRLGA